MLISVSGPLLESIGEWLVKPPLRLFERGTLSPRRFASGSVQGVFEGFPAEIKSHPRDHDTDDRSGQTIRYRQAGHAAQNADRRDKRGNRVRACVPGTRDQNG